MSEQNEAVPPAPEPPKVPSKIVVNQEHQACGCVVTEYSDRKKLLSPCLGCGFASVAEGLSHAVDVLLSMADRARRETSRQNVQLAAERAAQQPGASGPAGPRRRPTA